MELWDTRKTAAFLGITYPQMSRLLNGNHSHPPYILVGQRKRFLQSEVEKWVLENQITSAKDKTND